MLKERSPHWAGQFYPAHPEQLSALVRANLDKAREREQAHTILAMAPHAGYQYSGGVAGATLGMANLSRRILLLGPKHTSYGLPLAVWSSGAWHFPGGKLNVDEELARAVLAADPRLQPDSDAHRQEHSLEVMVPFLAAIDPETTIVPIAVGDPDPRLLIEVGAAIGKALKAFPEPVSMVVSSDMSHRIPAKRAKELDAMALEAALTLDPLHFYNTVRGNRISMCGVLPMTVALAAANVLGASEAEITAYANSGEVTGDYQEVVGYAGMIIS